MTEREALKMALEALKFDRAWLETDAPRMTWDKNNEAITAIKEALAQPEQEPMTWQLKPHQPPEEGEFIEINARWGKRFVEMPNPLLGDGHVVRFYFDPPQRTWVGLTDEDKEDVMELCGFLGKPLVKSFPFTPPHHSAHGLG